MKTVKDLASDLAFQKAIELNHDVYSKKEVYEILKLVAGQIDELDETKNFEQQQAVMLRELRAEIKGAIFQMLPRIKWSDFVEVEVDLSLDGNEIETEEHIDFKVEDFYNEIVDTLEEDVFSDYDLKELTPLFVLEPTADSDIDAAKEHHEGMHGIKAYKTYFYNGKKYFFVELHGGEFLITVNNNSMGSYSLQVIEEFIKKHA